MKIYKKLNKVINNNKILRNLKEKLILIQIKMMNSSFQIKMNSNMQKNKLPI